MDSPDDSLPPTKQKLEFSNDSSHEIEFVVEMIPEYYMLQPKDKVVLIADAENAPRNEGYTIKYYGNVIWVYAAWDVQPMVFINGRRANYS